MLVANADARGLFYRASRVFFVWERFRIWTRRDVVSAVRVLFGHYSCRSSLCNLFLSSLSSSLPLSLVTHPFIRWLGQNSKQGKLARQLGDIQVRMRLAVSGDKTEIRRSYVPFLVPHLVMPLADGTVRVYFILAMARGFGVGRGVRES